MKIPMLDLTRLHKPLLHDFKKAFTEIMQTSQFIGGRYLADFETAFAKFCGVAGCVGVANGTDALMLCLRVLGIKSGDVVIVPALTFIATAEAVTLLGATPRFVDIDPLTYTMDPMALAKVDTQGVKAVIPVHLYGQPVDMDPILDLARKHHWAVVEDCAQAHGATYRGKSIGSFGDLAAFSFYPGKNLGALGDAGAIVGDDVEKLAIVRRLANHGRLSQYEHLEPGINSRLDALQAAALLLKLPYLQEWNARRVKNAELYEKYLAPADLVLPHVGFHRTHVFHQYTVQVKNRQLLTGILADANIGYGTNYRIPLHLQPAYAFLGYQKGDFPVSEQLAERGLNLPLDPTATEEQIRRVSEVVCQNV
jgi:dTDP-4-amino-4,6-dideoxygalactose transaminase